MIIIFLFYFFVEVFAAAAGDLSNVRLCLPNFHLPVSLFHDRISDPDTVCTANTLPLQKVILVRPHHCLVTTLRTLFPITKNSSLLPMVFTVPPCTFKA